ncbi:hypothetical protein QZH41_000311 [Actinostola sp. cb2023]|nr:hypothetical protein QZH41_000311 [Actinostola sp. cb2023]
MPSITDYDNASTAARKLKTADEKLAFDLAKDLIRFKLGEGSYLTSKTASLLRKLSTQIERKHEPLFKNMCNRLDLNERNATTIFGQVADEIIGNDINWGRIVVLYTFGGKVAQYFHDHGIDVSEEVASWIGKYMVGKSEWIRKVGGWTMGHLVIKIVVILCLLFLTLLAALLPFKIGHGGHGSRRQRILSYCNCFAGGVFLATSLLDLLPMIQAKFNAVFNESHITTVFPVAEFTTCIGFFLVLILEQTVHTFHERSFLHGHGDYNIKEPLLEDSSHGIHRNVEIASDGSTDSFATRQTNIQKDYLKTREQQTEGSIRTYILVLALSLHSVFEGLALGLIVDVDRLIQIAVAVLIHKSIIGFSMGSTVRGARTRLRTGSDSGLDQVWTKLRTGPGLDQDWIRLRTGPGLDQTQGWTRLRTGPDSGLDQTQDWTRLRTGPDSGLDQTQDWTRLRTGPDSGLDQDWTRLRTGSGLDQTQDWTRLRTGPDSGLDQDWTRLRTGPGLDQTQDWTRINQRHSLANSCITSSRAAVAVSENLEKYQTVKNFPP